MNSPNDPPEIVIKDGNVPGEVIDDRIDETSPRTDPSPEPPSPLKRLPAGGSHDGVPPVPPKTQTPGIPLDEEERQRILAALKERGIDTTGEDPHKQQPDFCPFMSTIIPVTVDTGEGKMVRGYQTVHALCVPDHCAVGKKLKNGYRCALRMRK